LGYKGDFSDAELSAVTPKVVQLRLEIARLEELRLNRCDLAHTYEALAEPNEEGNQRLPLGFLRGAVLTRNTAFEHHFLGSSDKDIPDSNVYKARQRAVLWAINAARDVTQRQHGLTLLDKLVLVALHTHRCSDNMLPHPFVTGAAGLTDAVHSLARARARQHASLNKPFATRICKLITAEVAQGVMEKLALRGYVTAALALTEASAEQS
jgi:hypothetical protein